MSANPFRPLLSTGRRRKKDEAHVPVLRGYVKDGKISVFCPFCDSWHVHDFSGNEISGRYVHCITPQGQRQYDEASWGQYFVAPFRRTDLEAISRAVDETNSIRKVNQPLHPR